ncbi:MAG TPA: heparan-alpha-glucosaminide N-acetyltransferase domain-containing protein [Sphingomonas sp.]|nr:heparan-alpha-glucosaminide N-acetyltransferase domain-containing protein [Sphingomonas sp.]
MASVTQANDDVLVEPTPIGLTRSGAHRLDAIDMLRGLVIAIMVLDHARDYFHYYALRLDPTDPANSWPALFATRWVTHLCAATFVFLAGVSVYFQKANGKAGLPAFLIKRGLWLILLEVTVISFGFNFGEPFIFLQVIWAIGASMICMSLIARLPARWVLALGLVILLLYPFALAATAHAAVDATRAGSANATDLWGVIRTVTLAPGVLNPHVLAYYAFLPWLSVMCLGFGLGPLYRLDRAERTRRLLPIAIGLLVAFVLLRLLDTYGDPSPWTYQATPVRTVMSFMNLSKYPPSPDFVFATLGISIMLFLTLESLRGPVARILLAFGRTPLFTYICHIYILHLLMLAVVLALGFPFGTATDVVLSTKVRDFNWGFDLPVVYAVWFLVLGALAPLSTWFAALKARRRDWWLSYL